MTEKSAFRLFSFVTPDITGDSIGSSEHLYFAEVRICESLHNRDFFGIRELNCLPGAVLKHEAGGASPWA